jgi:hypothetical protein
MKELKPNSERAIKARNLIFASLAIGLIFILRSLYEYYQLSSMGNGRSFNPNLYFNAEDPLEFLSRVSAMVSIVSTVYFIMWFRRAYFNLHELVQELRFGESAAAWSWFVPILNFFAPYLIMLELVKKSKEKLALQGSEPNEEINPNAVAFWWLTYFGSVLFSVVAAVFLIGMDFKSVKTAALIGLVGQALYLISGVFIANIIAKYDKIEQQLGAGFTEIDRIGAE